MKIPISAIVIGTCLMPAAAWAVDWSVQSTATETIELNDNQFLATSPAGGTVSSYSSISERAEARTPTTKFDFTSDASYRKYWGPGAAGLPLTDNLAYGFNAHYELAGKNAPDRTWVEADFRQQNSAFALLNQLGILTNITGAIDRLTFSGGADHSLTARDTVSLFATSTKTSYEPPSAGTAFQDTNANAVWRRRLTSLTSFTVSTGAEWLSYSNAFNTNVLILRNQAGLDSSLTPLLSFHGSAGAAYVQTIRGIGTAPPLPSGSFLLGPAGHGDVAVLVPPGLFEVLPAPGSPIAISPASLGFVGDLLLTYKPLKTTTVTLAASQTIGPSIVGSLFQLSTVRASVLQNINAASSVTVAADVSRTTAGTTTDFASASVSYSYQWVRAWTASVTYRYLHRFQATGGTTTVDPITNTPTTAGLGPASANSLMFTVSRNFADLGHTN